MFPVLVAEDEIWIRNAIVEMTARSGNDYKVIGEAADGEEAWELINHLWPVILVTDIVMPKKDGLWLVQQISDNVLPVVSIVISGYDKFSYAQTCIKYGVVEYLLKPVIEEQFHEALNRCKARIGSLSVMHQKLSGIRDFIDSMQDSGSETLIAKVNIIVNEIFYLKGVEKNQRNALFSIFASSLNEMHKNINSICDIAVYNTDDYDSVSKYFESQVETWIRRYQRFTGISNKQVIKKVNENTKNHYKEDLRLKEIADLANLSISRFCAVFKKETNDTFVNFLNSIRIEKAKSLLLNSDYRVHEVAEMTGFLSLQYFNRVFRNTTGLTPSEYRKKDDIL